MIRVITSTERSRKVMEVLAASLTPARTKPIVERLAWESKARLVAATPKGFTGRTRAAWEVIETDTGFSVTNTNRVMLFLEQGTPAHGPVRARALYIPLRASAMVWHEGLQFGRDFVLAKRVRGIRPMRIVAKERRTVAKQTVRRLSDYLKGIIKSV